MFRKKDEPAVEERVELPTLRDSEFYRLQREYDEAKRAHQEAAEKYERLASERRDRESMLNYRGMIGLDEAAKEVLATEEKLRAANNDIGRFKLEREPLVRQAYREEAEQLLSRALDLAEALVALRGAYEELRSRASKELDEPEALPHVFPYLPTDLRAMRKELVGRWGFRSLETPEVRERLERDEAERLSSIASSEHTRAVRRIFSDPTAHAELERRAQRRQAAMFGPKGPPR